MQDLHRPIKEPVASVVVEMVDGGRQAMRYRELLTPEVEVAAATLLYQAQTGVAEVRALSLSNTPCHLQAPMYLKDPLAGKPQQMPRLLTTSWLQVVALAAVMLAVGEALEDFVLAHLSQ